MTRHVRHRETIGRWWRLFMTAVVLAVGTSAPVEGQIVQGRPSLIHQQLTHLSWTLDGDSTDVTVSQWYVPLVVSGSIAPHWELSLFSALSGSDADWDVAGDEYSGLSDSRIQLAHSLANDRVLISGGVSLPTGKTELTDANRALLPWLTSDFFNFPLKYPGEGLNLFGQIGAATQAGDWTLGAGVAIHYAGEYTPFDDGRDYQPGTRFVLTESVARDWEGSGRVGLDASIIFSSDDKSNGSPVFADGTMFDVVLSGRKQYAHGRIDASVRAILRAKNKLLDQQSLDLALEENNTNGSDLRFSITGRHALTEQFDGWLSLDARILAANGYDPGSPFFEDAANITGLGGGIDVRLGDRASGGIGLRLWRGTSDGAATFEPLSLSGVEIIQRLSFTL